MPENGLSLRFVDDIDPSVSQRIAYSSLCRNRIVSHIFCLIIKHRESIYMPKMVFYHVPMVER